MIFKSSYQKSRQRRGGWHKPLVSEKRISEEWMNVTRLITKSTELVYIVLCYTNFLLLFLLTIHHVKFKSYSTDLYAVEYLGTLFQKNIHQFQTNNLKKYRKMKLIYNSAFIMYDSNVGKIQRLCLRPDIFISTILILSGITNWFWK